MIPQDTSVYPRSSETTKTGFLVMQPIFYRKATIWYSHTDIYVSRFTIDEKFTGLFWQLLVKALTDIPQPALNADLISCLTTSFRICRNACAKFVDNQTILRQHRDVLSSVKDLLTVLGGFVQLREELLVLARCAVQFIGNFSSGNVENQLIVVDLFFPVFR